MSESFVRRERGFTLIELMVVVVVIGILASVAYPAYTEYVNRGRRAQVQTQMVLAQQWIERFYAEAYRYDQNAAGTAIATSFGTMSFATSPPAGEGTAAYTLSVNATAQGYTLTATRTGVMANDPCGNPTVTHTGIKGASGFNSSKYSNQAAAVAACWR